MKVTLFALICAAVGVVLGVSLATAKLGEPAAIVLSPSGEAAASAAPTIPVPRVSVDQETYDFGNMERHTTQSHDFLFTNAGNAPLELTVGDTTCKCTIGKVPEDFVEPGATVPVKLTWTAETEEPEFRQTARIHTNDPLRREVVLTVAGRVSDPSSYFPREFLFGNLPLGTSRSAEIKVVSFRDEPFEITSTELIQPAAPEHFDVEVEDLPPAEYPNGDVQAGYRITVNAKPSLPFGQIGGWLKIRTNLKSFAEVDVPLAGKVTSDFSIYGPGFNEDKDLLNLGQVIGSEGKERRLLILLLGDRGKETELRIRETYPEYLEAELGERKQVSEKLVQVPLVVRVKAGAPPAVHMGGRDGNPGRIVVETNHPKVPELTVNVQFTVQ